MLFCTLTATDIQLMYCIYLYKTSAEYLKPFSAKHRRYQIQDVHFHPKSTERKYSGWCTCLLIEWRRHWAIKIFLEWRSIYIHQMSWTSTTISANSAEIKSHDGGRQFRLNATHLPKLHLYAKAFVPKSMKTNSKMASMAAWWMTGGAVKYSFGQYTHQKSALYLEPFPMKSTKTKSKMVASFEYQWHRQLGKTNSFADVLHTYNAHVLYGYLMHPNVRKL